MARTGLTSFNINKAELVKLLQIQVEFDLKASKVSEIGIDLDGLSIDVFSVILDIIGFPKTDSEYLEGKYYRDYLYDKFYSEFKKEERIEKFESFVDWLINELNNHRLN